MEWKRNMIGRQLEKLRQMDTDRCLFILGNVFLLISVVVGIIIVTFDIPLGRRGDCNFHRLTGFYCMGCGGTRSLLAYLQGHFITSMKYNIFTAYALTCFLLFMGSHYLRVLTKGRIRGFQFRLRFVIIGIVLLLGQFIIRNTMLVQYHSILWPVG